MPRTSFPCAIISRSISGKSRAKRYPLTRSSLFTTWADVMMPHLRCASCPSQPVLKSTAMPSREGRAASAAARVNTTLCPRAPVGDLSLAISTSVNTPSNALRFGCPCTTGNSTAIACNRMLHLFRKTRCLQPTHSADFLHRDHACFQQIELHGGLCGLVAAEKIVEDKLYVPHTEALAEEIACEMFREQPGDGLDGAFEGVVRHFSCRGLVHIVFQAKQHRRQIEGVRDHAQKKLLPAEMQVGVGAAGEAQDLRLLLAAEDGHLAGAFDLVLPPAHHAFVLRGRGLLHPKGELLHAVACKTTGVTRRIEEGADGFEGDLKTTQAEGRVGARIQADVHQLAVEQRDGFLSTRLRIDLGVAWRLGLAIPFGVYLHGCAVDGPEAKGEVGVAGEFHLHGAEAADDDVFEHLLDQGAEGVSWIRSG